MATVAAPPDDDGWCSLSLHAGGTLDGAEPRRRRPRAAAGRRGLAAASRAPSGCRPSTATRSTSTRSTSWSRATRRRSPLPEPEPSRDRRGDRRARARASSPTAPRCRPGSARSRRRSSAGSPRATGGDYGVHSEMFTDGLMRLHEAGKVTNRKGQFDGVSVATFAGGTARALRLARRQRRGRLPAGRARQLARADRPQPDDGHDQRRDRGRHPRPGGRRHDRRRPVLGHRRPRGLRRRPGARRSRTARCSACRRPSTVGGELRSRIVPWFERRRGDHDAAPPGRRDRHRARRRRAPGPDRAPARRGAGRDRPPGLPRRAARGRRARLRRALGRSRRRSASCASPPSDERLRPRDCELERLRDLLRRDA